MSPASATQMRVEGRWTPEHTQRWFELGRPAVGYLPYDGGRLDFLRDLEGLQDLAVAGGRLPNALAVESCTDLRRLVFHVNVDTGTRRLDLSGLAHLEFLDMDDCLDAASLPHLSATTMIYMHWPHADLEPLSGNTALRRLRLNSARRLSSVRASHPPHVETLAVGRTGVVLSLEGIEAYRNTLRSLILEELRVDAYEPLSALTRLRGLQLECTTNVASLEFVRGLPELEWFNWIGAGTILDGDLSVLDRIEHVEVRPRRGYNPRREPPVVHADDLPDDDPDDELWI